MPEPIPNAHDGGDHICVALTPTDFYLVLVASGKAAEIGLTLPAIRAWYADGLPAAPRRARSNLCAGCPFASGSTSAATVPEETSASPALTAEGALAKRDAIVATPEGIAVPNWPTRHTSIDRPQGEHL